MSQLKLTADSGGGTVAIKGPASTTGNAAIELTVPGTGNSTLATTATAGKILQVVHQSTTTHFSTSSTSYVDVTGVTANITPSSTSSKVFIFLDVPCHIIRSSGSTWEMYIKILRDSTAIFGVDPSQGNYHCGIGGSISSNRGVFSINKQFVDSPNTTSQVTYKLQVKHYSNQTIDISYGNEASHITLMEVAA